MKMTIRSVFTLPILCFLVCIVHWTYAEPECEAGVCEGKPNDKQSKCSLPAGYCQGTSLYRNGGSAQAYKPNAPFKSNVCQDEYSGKRYNVATWPLWRSSHYGPPPKINVFLSLWSCTSPDEGAGSCCCKPLNQRTDIEIWQTRPDGSYSSLHPGQEDGDCRARIKGTSFSTYAPGSTGAMGGLGPCKFDMTPFGPPVLHILVTAPGHLPTLNDIPILMKRKTLEQRSAWWPDWRGASWIKQSSKHKSYEIMAWTPDVKARAVDVQLAIYMKADEYEGSLESQMCPSWMYGLPSSFFQEPISVCASSLLDFFAF